MAVFEKSTRIAAAPERVFAFHEAPGALEKLIPPWDPSRLLERSPATGLAVGTRVVLETRLGPLRPRLVALHTGCEPPHMFRDELQSGPFRRWVHTHRMDPDGAGGTLLHDRVEYELPLGLLGELVGGWYARRRLERMFDFRHAVTKAACETPG
jgi:hypothetical protein